ncbi:MAG: glycerate kinase [Bacteroidetes bacterium]|nr:glycerate kinase [Bacteroidota bacterium]MCL6098046.1 glycerate kinase [Bacteroidota bacterium]
MNDKLFKILIAPNSFKECADSVEISELIKTSLFKLLPNEIKSQIDFSLNPISDGGDGFISVCQRVFGAELLHFEISTPYNDEKFFCPVGYFQDSRTIFIESAEIFGLKIIPDEFRNPIQISSKGLGELLLQLYDSAENGIMDIENVIIGIGGTGINDLGMGMMEVFGLEFYDRKDNQLEVLPKNFLQVEKIVVPEVNFPFHIEMIIDVENPLLGINGASLTFAEQKGATDEEAKQMEKGFAHILDELEVDEVTQEGLSGAGGGIAAALKLFFNAEETFADKFVREELKIHPENSNVDMVITGEGKLDTQTLMNKGAFIVVNEFAKQNVPIHFLCGVSEGDLPEIENMKVLEIAEYFDSPEDSIKKIDQGIDLACKRISKDIIQLFAKKNSNPK